MLKRPGFLLSQSNFKVLFNIKTIKLKHDWTLPEGYDTGIKIYCRKRKNQVPLILKDRNFVKWYICGPTVYDVSHIGHASCYIRLDIINRILREFFDIRPVIALGVTDIDDKIIIQAYKKKVEFRDVAKQYELEFFSSLNKLNVLPPAFVLRVSEHIPEIIEFISKIIDKGDAYAVEDGSVYFSMPEEEPDSSSPKISLKPGQKNHADFALWKGAKPGEPYWDSPWGKGRPGWHIECSAMASKVFGSELDLHGGGIDLEFPHHKNEETQSRSYHGCKQWVNYWTYTGELQALEQKMSKSLKNYVSISEFLKGHTADNLRMYCFISKYSRALHYDSNSMMLPVTVCNTISKFLSDCSSYVKGNWFLGNISESELLKDLEETSKKVRQCLEDDFDTGQCHLALMDLIKRTVKALNETPDASSSRSPAAVHAVAQYVGDVYRAFGFQLAAGQECQTGHDEQKLEYILNRVVSFRTRVRAGALESQEKSVRGNLLNACDSLRNDLGTVGVVIKDQGKDKSSWSFVDVQNNASAESTG